MAGEIERKFLVSDDRWRDVAGEGQRLVQAYLAMTPNAEIRVRIIDDAKATLTVKSAKAALSREEIEIDLPLEKARLLIAMRVEALIEKIRHHVTGRDGLPGRLTSTWALCRDWFSLKSN